MDIEQEITAWKIALQERAGLSAGDLQELEDHLRDQMDDLEQGGLQRREALLIALLRMGHDQDLTAELSKVHSDRLWKQLFAPTGASQAATDQRQEVPWVLVAAVVAALLGKVPLAFGVDLSGSGAALYMRNLSLFVVPVLMGGYYLLRRFSTSLAVWLVGIVGVSALTANLYPFSAGSNTAALLALHLPLLLWLGLGLAYCGDDWRRVRAVWDFTRFSGEFFIYAVLIAAGGMVFMMLTTAFAEALGFNAENLLVEWIGLSGLLGLPIVAAYLVEKKRSLIANLAPVLAKIFIPLFLAMMAALIIAAVASGQSLMQNRDTLILVDALLILVVGMVLYDLSARDDTRSFGTADALNVGLIFLAIIVDGLALAGIAVRLSQFGFSPNRTAALGENVLLLANLGWLARGYIRFAQGRGNLENLMTIQARMWPVYLIWLAFVVWVMPVLYGFA